MPARVRAGGRGHAGDVLAGEHDLAGGRLELAGDEIEIGGLAGAVGADDGGQRAGRKRAADSIHRHVAAEADGQLTRLEGGVTIRHGAAPTSPASSFRPSATRESWNP